MTLQALNQRLTVMEIYDEYLSFASSAGVVKVGELVKEQPAVAAQSRQRFDFDVCRLTAERNGMSGLDVRNAFSRFSELSARAVCDEQLRALIRQFVTEMSDETINRVSIDGGSDNATLSGERVTTTYTVPLKLNHVQHVSLPNSLFKNGCNVSTPTGGIILDLKNEGRTLSVRPLAEHQPVWGDDKKRVNSCVFVQV